MILNKQLSDRWFETSWGSCDVIVMRTLLWILYDGNCPHSDITWAPWRLIYRQPDSLFSGLLMLTPRKALKLHNITGPFKGEATGERWIPLAKASMCVVMTSSLFLCPWVMLKLKYVSFWTIVTDKPLNTSRHYVEYHLRTFIQFQIRDRVVNQDQEMPVFVAQGV